MTPKRTIALRLPSRRGAIGLLLLCTTAFGQGGMGGTGAGRSSVLTNSDPCKKEVLRAAEGFVKAANRAEPSLKMGVSEIRTAESNHYYVELPYHQNEGQLHVWSHTSPSYFGGTNCTVDDIRPINVPRSLRLLGYAAKSDPNRDGGTKRTHSASTSQDPCEAQALWAAETVATAVNKRDPSIRMQVGEVKMANSSESRHYLVTLPSFGGKMGLLHVWGDENANLLGRDSGCTVATKLVKGPNVLQSHTNRRTNFIIAGELNRIFPLGAIKPDVPSSSALDPLRTVYDLDAVSMLDGAITALKLGYPSGISFRSHVGTISGPISANALREPTTSLHRMLQVDGDSDNLKIARLSNNPEEAARSVLAYDTARISQTADQARDLLAKGIRKALDTNPNLQLYSSHTYGHGGTSSDLIIVDPASHETLWVGQSY